MTWDPERSAGNLFTTDCHRDLARLPRFETQCQTCKYKTRSSLSNVCERGEFFMQTNDCALYESVEDPDFKTIDPHHYTRLNPQPAKVIAAWELDYFRGSAIKYITRAGHKKGEPIEIDIRKAIRHLELFLEHLPNPD